MISDWVRAEGPPELLSENLGLLREAERADHAFGNTRRWAPATFTLPNQGQRLPAVWSENYV